MREYGVTVTSKGRLTLPASVRRQLGLDVVNRVTIVVEGENGARLRRVEHDVKSVRGLIATPPGLESQDFDELIEEVMTDHIDEMLVRFREGGGNAGGEVVGHTS